MRSSAMVSIRVAGLVGETRSGRRVSPDVAEGAGENAAIGTTYGFRVVVVQWAPYLDRAEDTRRVYQPETAAQQPEALAPHSVAGGAQPAQPAESGLVARSSAAQAEPAEERGSSAAERWVSRQLHRELLERFVAGGSRVLELSAGSGQYTELLHRLGCRVTVVAPREGTLEVLRAEAREGGFDSSVESWHVRELGSLEGLGDAAHDAVVAYGGPLSLALERRDRALGECMRVLRPRGVLLLSVPSLWGTLHGRLARFLGHDLVHNRAVIRSGNLADAALGIAGPRHLFRAAELDAFLRRAGLELLSLSASSALSTGIELPAGSDPTTWSALLEYERAACVERGYLDSGSDIIAVARR
jgi:SAM-dependent methyltransferase